MACAEHEEPMARWTRNSGLQPAPAQPATGSRSYELDSERHRDGGDFSSTPFREYQPPQVDWITSHQWGSHNPLPVPPRRKRSALQHHPDIARKAFALLFHMPSRDHAVPLVHDKTARPRACWDLPAGYTRHSVPC